MESFENFSQEGSVEKNREKIGMIEGMEDSPISKGEILLVYLGEKPAAWFPAENEFYEHETEEEKEEKLNFLLNKAARLKSVFEKTGISFKVKESEEEIKGGVKRKRNILIGNDAEKLKELEEALDAKDSRRIGIALWISGKRGRGIHERQGT